MFVSVVLDPGGIDSARALVNILVHSGFRRIQKSCWESMNVSEPELLDLKKEIDRVTDYYDTIRLYQFPVDGMFLITELKQKKWKKCQLKSSASPAAQRPRTAVQSNSVRKASQKIPVSRKNAVVNSKTSHGLVNKAQAARTIMQTKKVNSVNPHRDNQVY